MGAGRRLFERWRDRGVPTEASVGDVELVLDEFFRGCCKPGAGSHVRVVRHSWLAGLPRLPLGMVRIYRRHGKVPEEALKDLVFAVRCVEWLRETKRYREDEPIPPELGQALEREFG
jgi:hypothetical protein